MVVYDSRRKFPRVSFNQKVGFLTRGEYQVTKAIELGEGGISCHFSHSFELAQRVLITLPTHRRHFFCIQGEVRNCIKKEDGTFTIGIRFLSVSPEAKKDIRNFVSSIEVSAAA